MSDAAITAIVAGAVNAVGLIIGFLTLWVKLKYNAEQTREVKTRAEEVSSKIDDNTKKTEAVDEKASTIVQQTNGAMDEMRQTVRLIGERVAKLEDYNRSSAHRQLDATNAVMFKLTELLAVVQAMKKPPEAS